MTTKLALEPRPQLPIEDRTWPVSFLGMLAPDEDLVESSGLPDAEIEVVEGDATLPTVEVLGIIEAAYTNSYGDSIPANKAVDVRIVGTKRATTYKITVSSRTTREQTLGVECVLEGK